MADETALATAVGEVGTDDRQITVTLSNELVHLLSEQMYQSPLKAIEELVVNSYDADAKICRLFVPLPPANDPVAIVYDDGVGMDPDGLQDLWHIGRSNKRDAETAKRLKRKQIGKFGIGKLATYAIANLVTYLSKTPAGIFGVTMDFRNFAADPTGGQPITLTIKEISDKVLTGDKRFEQLFAYVQLVPTSLTKLPSWTFAVLEDLKPKMGGIRRRDLKWVLSTAMPLKNDFALVLNGDSVESRMADFAVEVKFAVTELPAARIEALEADTADGWHRQGDALVSRSFPQGVRGEVIVTRQSLYTGKSTDLARSHGFFVKVRERLIDESDPLFGIEPLSYEVFNRFRADLRADDLDQAVTAPREDPESSDLVVDFRRLLITLFYEARGRWDAAMKKEADTAKRQKEAERNFVNPALVERPIADLIAIGTTGLDDGSDADESWFYLRIDPQTDRNALLERLYKPGRERYRYVDIENGRSGRLVVFEPDSSTFFINVDHPLVQAHADPRSLPLLEDVVTAEALLEVYLRAQGMSARQVGEVLERRDQLLRSLAMDHLHSLQAIASELRNSSDDERDLEVNVVIAARALGFVAKHIGGADRTDGVARYSEYPGSEQKITLETKSSAEVPSLGAIDFGGLAQHMKDESASGCLLVAPSYPGTTRGDDAQAAKRAETLRISCWTVDGLASVVEAAEARHISAADVLSVVHSAFAPEQVNVAVQRLLAEPTWVPQRLYGAVVDALRSLEGRLADRPRTIDQIASEITHEPEFRNVPGDEIRRAVEAVVGASQGLLILVGTDRIALRGDYDELERRVSQLIGRAGQPRRKSTFRAE